MASPAPTEAEELAALNKALTALGFTDDVKLERFLHVLMPRVIDQMASKHESTKRKVLEILSHVNKRLKAVPAMPLPLEDLTALYVNEERPPTVRNFALIYVEQAHARAAPEARAAQILPLLKGISARPRQAADIICRLAITALAVPEKHVPTAVDDMEFMTNANDRAVFLRHALLYLMYQPNTVGHAPVAAPAPSPAEQAMRGVANVAGVPAPPTNNATESTAAPPQPPAAPPGMSPSSVERILGPNAPALSIKDLATRKLALLEFFHRAKDSTLPPAEALMHYLVAACDADHETSRRGEELLRRRCVWDTNRPTVDLEDSSIVTKLYRAFLGDPENVPVESRTIPASPALKLRLASLMCRSVAAANAFPYTVQAIFTGLYGVGTNLRLKSAAMELAVWVLRHATDAHQRLRKPADRRPRHPAACAGVPGWRSACPLALLHIGHDIGPEGCAPHRPDTHRRRNRPRQGARGHQRRRRFDGLPVCPYRRSRLHRHDAGLRASGRVDREVHAGRSGGCLR